MLLSLTEYGQLHMSTEPLEEIVSSPAWTDILSNRIAIMATIALMLLNLPSFYRILSSLLPSITLARSELELEHSLSTARLRNSSAMVMALPFCLIADRFRIFGGIALTDSIQGLSLAFTCGVFLTYLFLRWIMWLICTKNHFRRTDPGRAVHYYFYNFFIVLSCLWILTVVILYVFNIQDAVYQSVLLWEAAILYLLSLIRTVQILASSCNLLSTILYLCGLELLPAAALVSCVVLVG